MLSSVYSGPCLECVPIGKGRCRRVRSTVRGKGGLSAQEFRVNDLAEKASACGVEMGYRESGGDFRHSPASTIRALVEALEPADGLDRSPISVRPGGELPFQGGTILTEKGETVTANSHLPEDFPFGYHSILAGGQRVPRRLIVSPGKCYLPAQLRTWGWAAQLYSLRSGASWGIGDLNDLCDLGAWSSENGAGVVMINPLGAVTPGRPIEASPYSPASRCFRNPVYLGLDHLCAGDPDLADLAGQGRALNGAELIDRDASWAVKSNVLEYMFVRFKGDHRFDAYRAKCEPCLEDFATFCALCEQDSEPWTRWPESLRRPDGAGVSTFKVKNSERIRYYCWLQWLLEEQLREAGGNVDLIQDLPVGVNPAGADPWIFRGAFAEGFTVGAPPDSFNVNGQNWGIAPLHPGSLSGPGLDCFVQMVRSGFAHSAALRIDHVMGLFRLFWIPEDGEPRDGAYVRYPARTLLDILAIESHRARAYVVGEDLGTVEPEVREDLRERNVLSYRLLLFEEDALAIPNLAMAAVTTHDLPTVAGLWDNSDFKAQRELGLNPPEEGAQQMKKAIEAAAGPTDHGSVAEITLAAHRCLAKSNAAVVLATLEDALGVSKRPNMPGTVDEWPNWRQPLPLTLEELEEAPGTTALIQTMNKERAGTA